MKAMLYKIFIKFLLPVRIAVRFELVREKKSVEDRFIGLDKKLAEIERLVVLGDAGRRLDYAVQNEATKSSAIFIIENMNNAKAFSSRWDVMTYAISLLETNEDVFEFGVYKGESINFIANSCGGRVFGFDSFDGLPASWRTGFEAGAFSLSSAPDVDEKVILVDGLFDSSLPGFLKDYDGEVGLVHIDCDLYESTKVVLDLLVRHLHGGCLILFDEFLNYPGWQFGEMKAFFESVESMGLSVEYLAYNKMHEQVLVRVNKLL